MRDQLEFVLALEQCPLDLFLAKIEANRREVAGILQASEIATRADLQIESMCRSIFAGETERAVKIFLFRAFGHQGCQRRFDRD